MCILFFPGGYPVDMPQYRSILRTESPDRVMSYDRFVEELLEHWQRKLRLLALVLPVQLSLFLALNPFWG